MEIEELKQQVESFRTELKRTGLKAAVDAIVAAIGSQELRIAELEARLGVTQHGTFPAGLESAATHDQAVALQQVKETAAAKARDTLKE